MDGIFESLNSVTRIIDVTNLADTTHVNDVTSITDVTTLGDFPRENDVTTSLTNATAAAASQKLISDENFVLLCAVINILVTVVSVLGCLGNALAIKTFLAMDLKDGVIVSFLVLAGSDLAYLVTMVADSVSLGFYLAEMTSQYRTWFPVEPYGVYIYLINLGILLHLLTVLTTTFLAVARCICVALPYSFKDLFSRRRSIWVHVTFCLLTVGSYVPVLAFMDMTPEVDARVNATRVVLWVSSKRDVIKENVWIVRDVFVTFMTQLVVTVCVFVMVRCLRAASDLRHKLRHYSTNLSGSVRQGSGTPTGYPRRGQGTQEPTGYPRLARKELSVVMQVVLISVVYIVCNLPKVTIDITAILVSEFTLGRSYQNMYLVAISVMELFQASGSSLNILVYLRYNSLFRRHCHLGW
ncbi:uncharacterized protein LOC131939290 [Physella acuta]|uniref:uncharacterized protein LOC131939290 n=1 Tax=Physella acuta TaxID=109671 RepID=UPI0027DC47C0|nr:uncharacterized protein LOC131939290 [Physella acuta]